MKTVSQIKTLGKDLFQKEADIGNTEMMQEIGKILNGEWSLDNAPKWFRSQPSSDGFDAVKDMTDFTSYLQPSLKITPYSGEDQDRRNADLLEQALMWQLKRTMNRKADLHRQVIEDAFSYGRIGAQVEYLPYLSETMKVFKGSDKRRKLAMRNGEYVLIHQDPITIFPYWSDYMLEGVMSVTIRPAQEVVDFWGEGIAKPLIEKLAVDDKLQWVTVYDYWDIEQRCVIVNPTETSQVNLQSVEGIELFNDDNKLPFLPWVVQDLGDPLKPVLYPLYKFDYWHTQNVMESALVSEVISYIMSPRLEVAGTGEVYVETGEPGGQLRHDKNTDVNPLPPPGIDRGLTEMIDRGRAKLSKSTISHSVQTGEFGSGTPFSGMKELIDLSARRERDGRNIVEKFYTEVFKQMLYWKDYTGDTMHSYGERGKGDQIVVTPPEQFTGEGLTFNPERLFFEVSLMPKKPENDIQAMNAANMAYQLGISKRVAMEIAGITNPGDVMDERRMEDVREAQHQSNIQGIMARGEFQTQMWAQQQAQQMQQAQQAQMQQQQPPQGVPQDRIRGVGNENLRGPGFDPAMGGMPPEPGNPGTSSPPIQGEANIGGA